MNFEEILLEYKKADTKRKEQIITDYLLLMHVNEANQFLENIFLNDQLDLKKHSVDILSLNPDRALHAAKHLLNVNIPNDELATLKYFGAYIIKKMGNKLDYNVTIPLLISAYNPQDYRDTKWSISMALANMVNEPVELITNFINLNIDAKDELFCNLKSYTTIDFDL